MILVTCRFDLFFWSHWLQGQTNRPTDKEELERDPEKKEPAVTRRSSSAHTWSMVRILIPILIRANNLNCISWLPHTSFALFLTIYLSVHDFILVTWYKYKHSILAAVAKRQQQCLVALFPRQESSEICTKSILIVIILPHVAFLSFLLCREGNYKCIISI